jgi:hypothetical protein
VGLFDESIYGEGVPLESWFDQEFDAAAAVNHYTLTSATGAFTLTGNPASRGLGMPAGVGAFSETGNPAGLQVGHRLTAATGAFTLSGNPATFTTGFTMAAQTGAFAIVGNPAALIFTAPPDPAHLVSLASFRTRVIYPSIRLDIPNFARTSTRALLPSIRVRLEQP